MGLETYITSRLTEGCRLQVIEDCTLYTCTPVQITEHKNLKLSGYFLTFSILCSGFLQRSLLVESFQKLLLTYSTSRSSKHARVRLSRKIHKFGLINPKLNCVSSLNRSIRDQWDYGASKESSLGEASLARLMQHDQSDVKFNCLLKKRKIQLLIEDSSLGFSQRSAP